MRTRVESIKTLLEARALPDLAAMYTPEMEVQVLVARDGGSREGDYKGFKGCTWTDGTQQWFPFRIPKNPGGEPEDNTALPMTYDLAAHAEGVGMTGWNWKRRVSQWMAFDFDAITGHSDKHAKKLDDIELNKVREMASALPWVTVRRSASGKGLHLYVYVEDVPTQNHHEHAALARAILGQMSALAGFDFTNSVDVCGSNIWVYHRKQTVENRGFELLKQGTVLPKCQVPISWKDHVKVTSGQRKRVMPSTVEEKQHDLFDELTGQRPNVKLDDEHKRLIEWLKDNNCVWWWSTDQHLLVTHTIHLQDAHEALTMRGVFKTMALGSEKGADHNCWCSPGRRGTWCVRRFTPGCAEDASWTQDGTGYTMCYLNRDPDLATAARHLGGVELEKGGFRFDDAETAVKAAKALGARVEDVPPAVGVRPAILKQHKDGLRLVIEVEHENRDRVEDMVGWIEEKGKWKRVLGTTTQSSESEVTVADDLARHVITENGDDAGWVIKADTGWHTEPLVHMKAALKSSGIGNKELELVIGASVTKPWTLVNRPFESEYPGDRTWNRKAAQLRIPPATEDGGFETWMKIFTHMGAGLDNALAENKWAQKNSIKTGAEYLMLWLTSLVTQPLDPLPYLFFYGPQNCGKSILHEAIDEFLIRGGVKRAGTALRGGAFNAELEDVVLCVIEEIDIAGTDPKAAYSRLKDWVTSPTIQIHRKGQTPYDTRNTTHWIQVANPHDACPIFPGDTRITMSYVPALDPLELIPKKQLRALLQREASFFLRHILSLELPPSDDRLNVPVIETEQKRVSGKANRSALERFIEEKTHNVSGEMIKFGDFYQRFTDQLDDEGDKLHWNRRQVSQQMPPDYPIGNPHGSSMRHIGNMAWDTFKGLDAKPMLVCRGEKLVPNIAPPKSEAT